MKCPFCGGLDDRVIDSRSSGEGEVTRRRRECRGCGRRYTTYERVEEVPRLVLKKDGRNEPFSRQKILQGLLKACEKRLVPLQRLEELLDLLENRINERFDYEVESRFIGEILMEELKAMDQVAYVRFASVYREFADVTEFIRELSELAGSNPESNSSIERGAIRREPVGGELTTSQEADRRDLHGRREGPPVGRPLAASSGPTGSGSLGEAEGAGDWNKASTDTR